MKNMNRKITNKEFEEALRGALKISSSFIGVPNL